MKHNSQFQKPSPEATSAGDHALPEIPTIEVHSVSDIEESAGAGTKGTKVAGKGVRFADLEEEQAKGSEQQTAVQSNSVAVDISDIGIKLKNEEEKAGSEAIEMDSVDFDKVTGTSTPISDDSPSLPTKHSTTAEDSKQSFMANATSDSSTEHEDKEEVIVATGNKNLNGTTSDSPSSSRAVEGAETNVQESLAQLDSTDQSQL